MRAVAVIAVMLFHFNPSWLPGGFAGVDVFFVISGFLMTGIIFNGIEQKKFSVLKFYVARANRIIPALAVLCIVLLVFGWFYLTPSDYKDLGKHIASSAGFFSNMVYWSETGYFDASSHEKWLLHTWSLSVEWQFYILFPLILVAIRKFMTLKAMKMAVLLGTILGFIFCVIATYKWPSLSYYLFPVRAWEMMLGGLAYLYPSRLKESNRKILSWSGLGLIMVSYMFVSEETPWPGYLAIFPVFGTFLIIQANYENNFITDNVVFQKMGAWSYSIYLWHWPLVVTVYYFSLNDLFVYLGILLSIFFGFLSNRYIEKIQFQNEFGSLSGYLKCKPVYMALIVSLAGTVVYGKGGFIHLAPVEYRHLIDNLTPSPNREKCHLHEYEEPDKACEYFGENISWATIGDSHSTEIAYALAEKLKNTNTGLKQFSFSGCKPSYKEAESFSECARWYNESVEYISNNKNIKNVVLSHRLFSLLAEESTNDYPASSNPAITDETVRILKHLDELILLFASTKENVYVFYPIPELHQHIDRLIDSAFKSKKNFNNISGTDVGWHEDRNEYIINHFDNANYPDNVHLLDPKDVFCDKQQCYAVKDGDPLYFDDNHPSILGATRLVELIK